MSQTFDFAAISQVVDQLCNVLEEGFPLADRPKETGTFASFLQDDAVFGQAMTQWIKLQRLFSPDCPVARHFSLHDRKHLVRLVRTAEEQQPIATIHRHLCRPELDFSACVPTLYGLIETTTGDGQPETIRNESLKLPTIDRAWINELRSAAAKLKPQSISDRPNADEAPAPKKSKRSTVKGEAEIKLISALTKHHEYNNGSLLNQEPIKNNELAQLAKVSKSSAARFFGKKFGEYRMYRERCKDKSTLILALKLLNQEFSPKILYGRQPPGESDREEE